MSVIALGDGRRVELGQMTSGGAKNETRYAQLGRDSVVVKIQNEYGRLVDEERALRFLEAHGVRVPRVIASGCTAHGQRFLVISHEHGVRTITPEGWSRFGRDLASLLELPISDCPFATVSTAEFVADHRDRLDVVRALLTDHLADEIDRAITNVAGVDRLVVTHGDPGSGNYLDNEAGHGTLLDWETASVSPLGLDLGRAAFIGLMDHGHSGIPGQLVGGLLSGYFAGPSPAPIRPELLNAWIVVGGLQFIHTRHVQPLSPERTPQVAARVLETYLASGRAAVALARRPSSDAPLRATSARS